MVDEFRHPVMNRRTDRYGGSEENRNRLLLELAETSIRATKEENPNMVVGMRMGCACGEGGYDFEETKRLALQMQELGIEYYHVTYAEGGPAPHSVPFQDGILLQFSKELKKILKIPVITSGIHDPKLAEKAVAEGQTDMVSTARCHVADAEFVNKIKENRLNDIIKCTDCGSCAGLFTVGVSCLHNPETGRERYNPKYQIWKGFKGAAALHPALQRKGDK
jgi:2-enoate reductase